ncbi:protein fuzzy homolog isoform X1 [Struthio camelus]|uniref:protein fuzzy homolog isoform X1 n=1 Tax=Struthio camelus TaxID=8801 RepID=UPI003603E774
MAEGGGALSLLCLAASSGVPLFCRSRGGPARQQLPFSLIGSLNGVHMFGANLAVGLRGASAEGARVAWRGYHDSVTLIALSSEPGASEAALGRLLDAVFSAMVLVLGLEELVPVRNVERLKRDLRGCFGLIDRLLGPGEHPGVLAGCLESAVPPPGPPRDALQERLERFAGAAGTGLGCLLGGGGRVLLATPPWWALPPPDGALLAWLLGGAPSPGARDLPLYLPHGSPTVPHRLLVLELVPGVVVALLCGPSPSLQHVRTQLLPQFWAPAVEQLRGCARPPPAPLPPGVLAYLLIDLKQRRSRSGVTPGGAQGGLLPPRRRGAALRRFYALVAPHYFPEAGGGPDPPGGGARLCYVAGSSHAACALLRPPLLLLLLLPPGPRQGLRRVARAALAALAPP